jgi:NAD-dependent deacetylase
VLEAGTRHLVAGRLREAIDCLQRAVALQPTHAAHHNLAVALRATGDIATALAHAGAAARLAPECAASLALVGSLASSSGDHASALAMFQHACAVDPAHDVSRYYLGIALAVTGDREAALRELHHVASDEARVPPSIRARAGAQVRDLVACSGAIAIDLCSVPLVTEIVGAVGPSSSTAAFVEQNGRAIDLAEARTLVAGAQRIVALTGAGISSASGLATRKELWRRFDRDEAVSIAQFRRDPRPLWNVIREFLADNTFTPNAAHHALAALPVAGIVTQNVEGLHQAAGCAHVLELHGTLLETRCEQCGARPGLSCAEAIARGPVPPSCACGAALRPDVVLFGEWVDRDVLARAVELVAECDLLLVIGTAADVAPAADLPLLALQRGVPVVEIKRNASRLVRSGALHLAGTAEDLLPSLV